MKTNYFHKIRLAAKLKQVAIAEKLGLSRSAVANYESQIRWPDDVTIINKYLRLAKDSGMDITFEELCMTKPSRGSSNKKTNQTRC